MVVKENDEKKNPVYFGWVSATSIAYTRSYARYDDRAFSEDSQCRSGFFVVGHKNLDMDALGSAVGMQLFASNVIENSYALYNEEQMSPDIERCFILIERRSYEVLMSVGDDGDVETNFFVDSCRAFKDTALTLSKEFYDLFTQTIVIDHHRGSGFSR